MCCNNFGYFANIMSQMMLPMLLIQSLRRGTSSCQNTGSYMPYSIFPSMQMPEGSRYGLMSGYYPAVNTTSFFAPSLNYASTTGGGSTGSTDYWDILGSYRTTSTSPLLNLPTMTTVTPKNYYINADANGVKRNPFDAFEAMCGVASNLTVQQASALSDKAAGVNITDDAWRADAEAKKPDVDANYKTQVKAFASSFIKGVDTKHGNGDGLLTYEEFEKYQLADLPAEADEETKSAMKKSAKAAFDRLNLNGGTTIDEKEMTALLAVMDYDNGSNLNGIITVNDYTRVSVQLAAEEKNQLDELLKDRYDTFFDTNA